MLRAHRRPPFLSPALWLLAALFATLIAAPAESAVPSLIGAAPVKRQVRPAFDVKSEALPIALNRAALAAARANDEMELALPDGTREMVVFDRIEDHGGGIKTSVGYVKALGRDYRVLITTGPSGSFGSIRTANTAYRIIPGDGMSGWWTRWKSLSICRCRRASRSRGVSRPSPPTTTAGTAAT